MVLCYTSGLKCQLLSIVLTLPIQSVSLSKCSVTIASNMFKLANTMESEATCSICLDIFDKPVLLTCGHNFCKKCIEGIVEVEDNNDSGSDSDCGRSFRCAQCRHHVELTSDMGVDSLTFNKALHNICQILREKNQRLSRTISWKNVCKQHNDEEENYFCQSCKCAVCPLCASADHTGFGHLITDLEEYIGGEKEKIERNMDDLKKIRKEIELKKSYLQKVVDDAKACERHCHNRADNEIQQLMSQLQSKRDLFKSDVTSQYRDLYGPVETMISVYKKLESEAITLESEYKTVNFGDPMRRIKNYQKLGIQLTSFLTFRMRSIPALTPPPDRLPQSMLGHLDQVYVAITKIQPLKNMREASTQTDSNYDKESFQVIKQEGPQQEDVQLKSLSDDAKSNNNTDTGNQVQNLQYSFSAFSPFKSGPAECGSQLKNAAFKFLSEVADERSPSPSNSNEESVKNFKKLNGKGLTLQRFTEKLSRGSSFHESLPSSPNFAFGGKINDNVFVFKAKNDPNAESENKNQASYSETPSTSGETSKKDAMVWRQTSLAVFVKSNTLEKDQKSSSAPNLFFPSTPDPNQHCPAFSSDKKWQLPKPKYDSNSKPTSWMRRHKPSKQHKKKGNSATPGPSTSGVSVGRSNVPKSRIFDSDDEEEFEGFGQICKGILGRSDSDDSLPDCESIRDEIVPPESKRNRFLPLGKSNDYSDDSPNGSSNDSYQKPVRGKRPFDADVGNKVDKGNENGAVGGQDENNFVNDNDNSEKTETESFSFSIQNPNFTIGRSETLSPRHHGFRRK